ncbi:MAG: ABC transporter permease [Bacteroidota bacterium]
MFRNYLKIAFRNIWKHKAFAAINVFGLALGMACCFLIIHYVWHESNYDNFYDNQDRLFVLKYDISLTSNEISSQQTPPPMGPTMVNDFPEVEAAARIFVRDISVTVSGTDKQMEVKEVFFADSSTTDIFPLEFLQGQASTVLDRPFSVILNETTAQTLFGSTDVVGRSLKLGEADNFNVTGVFKDWPKQSHIPFKMLVHYDNMIDVEPPHAHENVKRILEKNWIATHSNTYILLSDASHVETVNAKMPAFIKRYGFEEYSDKQHFSLFPIKDIHLEGPEATTSTYWLYLFIGIGLITLLIACINFVNLSTASSLNRAKEVGVRKVLGAGRGLLIGQFIGESMVLSFLAFILSLVISQLTMPYLNGLTGLEMSFAPWQNPLMFLLFIGIFITAGLLAGSYPAFFVSKFQAITALKNETGNIGNKPGGVTIRKALITLQFVAAISFISGAAIIFLQLNYMRNRPMGFQKELALTIPIDNAMNMNALFRPGDASVRKRMNTFDELLLSNPNIKAVTQCGQLPGQGAVGRNVWTDEIKAEDGFFPRIAAVDYDYVETFGIEVIAGREFDVSYGTDHLSSFVLNETAVESMNWDSPEEAIGQNMVLEGKEGKVIGVVKDYNFQSLHTAIEPLILEVRPGAFGFFGVRLENSNIPETLAFIESQWRDFFPGKTFEYSFLDETLSDAYQREEQLSSIIIYFAFIAILISCFGLLGLAALVTKHRFKEIGVRKILGATTPMLLATLAKDFLRFIAIGMILAVPLTWYFIQEWMNEFAYRIDFPWWVPFLTGLLVIAIAFVTISTQTVRAALANPVRALRYE